MVDPTPIRKEDTPDETAVEPVFPGVEAVLGVSIDEKRSLSIKTLFLRDTPPQQHEATLASLFCVTEVVKLREKRIEETYNLANAERRLKQLLEGDPQFTDKKAKLLDEMNQLLSDSAELRRDDERDFRASGRTGAYRPEGRVKSKIAGYAADVEKKRLEIKAVEDEVAQHILNCRKAIENYRDVVLPNIDSQIAIRRAEYGER